MRQAFGKLVQTRCRSISATFNVPREISTKDIAYTHRPTHRGLNTLHEHRIIQRDDSGQGGVNAFVCVSPNHPTTPHDGSGNILYGLPIAVKDNFCTLDLPTTYSSRMLQGFQPSYDATVVHLLKESGAYIIGKTNCDEFGMGSLNTHTIHGPVVNPHSPPDSATSWRERGRRSAGGSSGGSAAAVAASMCSVALSTDTGGSTRLPASYCGIAGLKPSYGMISRWGVISFADSLDCVGLMAGTVSRISRVYPIVSKFDPKDPTSAPDDLRQEARSIFPHIRTRVASEEAKGLGHLAGLRVGVPIEYFPAETDPNAHKSFETVLHRLQSCGAIITPISLPTTKYALSAYYVIASAEASSNLARYDGIRYGFRVQLDHNAVTTNTADIYALTRSSGFGSEVKKRILLGTYALTSEAFDNYFLQAQRVRKLVRADFDRVFAHPNVLSCGLASPTDLPSSLSNGQEDNLKGIDVILHPSAIGPAPKLENQENTSPLDTYVQDVLTVPASLAGLPALSVPMDPIGEAQWPIGISIVGQWGHDELVMWVGEEIERLVGESR